MTKTLNTLLGFLIVLVGAGLGVLVLETQPQHGDSLQQMQILSQKIQTAEQEIQQLRQDLIANHAALQQAQRATTQALRRRQDATVQQLQTLLVQDDDDQSEIRSSLLRIEQLLLLAEDAFAVYQNPQMTLTLLEGIDQDIKALPSHLRLQISATLQDDRQSLVDRSTIDTATLLAQLQQLSSLLLSNAPSIDNLARGPQNPTEQPQHTAQTTPREPSKAIWKQCLFPEQICSIFESGLQLGKIEDHRWTPKESNQQAYLNLLTDLQQARLAILLRDQQIWQSTLSHIDQSIDQFYGQQLAIQVLAKEVLSELKGKNVQWQVLDLGRSVQQVRQAYLGHSVSTDDAPTVGSTAP